MYPLQLEGRYKITWRQSGDSTNNTSGTDVVFLSESTIQFKDDDAQDERVRIIHSDFIHAQPW